MSKTNKEIIEEVLKSMIKEITHNCGELNEITLTGDNFKKCVKVQLEKALSLKEQDFIKFLENYLEMLNVPSYAGKISDFEKKELIRKELQELKGK